MLRLRANLFDYEFLQTWDKLRMLGGQNKRLQSDIKTNEDLLFTSQSSNISPMKIKQSIRRGQNNFIDGPTSIQSICPICPADQLIKPENKKSQPNHNNCLYINKTTSM